MQWEERKIIGALTKEIEKHGYKAHSEGKISVSGWDFEPDLVIRDERDNRVGLVEVKLRKASTRDIVDIYEMGQAVGVDKKIIAAPGGTVDAMEMAEDLGVTLLWGSKRKISEQLKDALSF